MKTKSCQARTETSCLDASPFRGPQREALGQSQPQQVPRALRSSLATTSGRPEAQGGCGPRSGILLIECLVYISVLFIVTGLAFAAFYRVLDTSKHLRRNAGEISQALQAGEHWRAAVRAATGPLRLVQEGDLQALHIPRNTGETVYLLEQGKMLRRQSADQPWTKVLSGIKTSTFQRDELDRVVSWRWELELQSQLKAVRVRPWFSFQAVPAGAPRP